MGTYYNGNAIDTTTKEQLSNQILNKVVKQRIESKKYTSIFDIFKTSELDGAGYQIEDIEVANLKSTDFNPEGQDALKKAKMDFTTLYHKINRERTFKATVSNKQIRTAMLSKENTARVANAIVNEIYNSSAIEDFDAMKELFKDIAGDQKAMVIADLNGNGANMDMLIKTIQTLATNMTMPSTNYNYAGFKREFNNKDELVLVIDSATKAKLDVDSLASAFNIDKKSLVGNIIVIDEMPEIVYTALTANKGIELELGGETNVITYKYAEDGTETISGKPLAFLLNKRAIINDPVERELEDERNASGQFTNYYLHCTDILSYSTLRNAVVLVD